MADRALAEILARCLFDAELRARLLADPEGTLRDLGVEPDEDTLRRVAAIDADALARTGARLDKKFLALGKPDRAGVGKNHKL